MNRLRFLCRGRVPTAVDGSFTTTRSRSFQEDIVRQTMVRRFDVETGHCADCGEHVEGRHPMQTSDALGVAQVQVGPQALTLARI